MSEMNFGTGRKYRFSIPILEDKVIRRPRIKKLIDHSLENYRMVYVQAFSGIGKTYIFADYMKRCQKQAEEILWFTCTEENKSRVEELVHIVETLEKESYIIIDQYEEYIDTPYQSEIINLIKRSKHHKIVLLGTGKLPVELYDYLSRGYISIIPGPVLMFTEEEMKHYLSTSLGSNVDVSEYPAGLPRIPLIMNLYRVYKVNEEWQIVKGETAMNQEFYACLDQIMYYKWPEPIREVMLRMTLFPSIEKELVARIFGEEKSFELLESWSRKACIIDKSSDTSYEISLYVKEYMKRIVKAKLSKEERKRVMQIGYYYYLEKKEYEIALDLMCEAEAYEELVEFMCDYIYETQLQIDFKNISQLYLKIPSEYVKKNKKLVTLSCIFELDLYDYNNAYRWYQVLLDMQQQYEEDTEEYLEVCKYILFLDVIMPNKDKEALNRKVKLFYGKFTMDSITDYFLGIHFVAVIYARLMYQWNCPAMMEQESNETALFELCGERLMGLLNVYLGVVINKQGRQKEGMVYLIKGISQCNKYSMIEVKLLVDDVIGEYLNIKQFKNYGVVDNIYKLLEQQPNVLLTQLEYEAIRTSRHLLHNEIAQVEKWWEQNQDNFGGKYRITLMEYNLLMIRVAVLKGESVKAMAWIELLTMYCERYYLDSYLLDVKITLAELYYFKNEWDEMDQVMRFIFNLIQKTGYVAVLAREGRICLELLCEYEKREPGIRSEPMYDKIKAMAEEYAIRYPDYALLHKIPNLTLTKSEITMLKQLATERSMSEIADELCISLNTVKHHTKNIYSKLKVNKRNSAVRLAKEYGLI